MGLDPAHPSGHVEQQKGFISPKVKKKAKHISIFFWTQPRAHEPGPEEDLSDFACMYKATLNMQPFYGRISEKA